MDDVVSPMRDRPTAGELRAVAARANPAASSDAAVATAHAIAQREETAGREPVEAWLGRLAALYGMARGSAGLERRLADDIRHGVFDSGAGRAAVRDHLIATVRAKLAETNPAASEIWPLLDGRPDGRRAP